MKRFLILIAIAGLSLSGEFARGAKKSHRPPVQALPTPSFDDRLLCARDLVVPVELQTAVTIRPKFQLPHVEGMKNPEEWGLVGGRRVESIRFLMPTGRPPQIVTASEDLNVRFFSLKTGTLEQAAYSDQELNGAVWAPQIEAVSRDESFFVTSGGITAPVVYYNLSGTVYYQRLDAHPFKAGPNEKPKKKERAWADQGYVVATLITSDSKHILSISDEGEVIAWMKRPDEFTHKKPVYLALPPAWRQKAYPERNIRQLVLSPDGTRLAMGLDNGRLLVYSVRDILASSGIVEPLVEASEGYFNRDGESWCNSALAYSSDGRFLIAAMAEREEGAPKSGLLSEGFKNTEIVVFDSQSLKIQKKMERNFGMYVSELLVGPAGYFVSVATEPGSAIKIWQLNTGELKAEASFERDPNAHYLSYSSGPSDPIHSAAISPDGHFLATGSDAGNLSIWNLVTARLVVTTRIKNDIRGLSFSSDGKYLGTGSHIGDSRVFEFKKLLEKGGVEASTLAVFVGTP